MERGGEKGSGIAVLMARHDDDDDNERRLKNDRIFLKKNRENEEKMYMNVVIIRINLNFIHRAQGRINM